MLFTSDSFCQYSGAKLFPYLINDKFVFCDFNATPIIKSSYDYAEPFWGGYAIVANANKFGIIDLVGRQIIPLRFRSIEIFKSSSQKNKENPEGIYFSINNDSAFYSYNGNPLEMKPKLDGYAVVMMEEESYEIFENNKKYGFIYNGDTLIKPSYDNIVMPSEGYSILIAKKDNFYGIITTENINLIPFEYSKIQYVLGAYVFDLEKEGSLEHCYFDYNGISEEKIKVHCGYKKFYEKFYKYLLVENFDKKIFYIDLETGKEFRK